MILTQNMVEDKQAEEGRFIVRHTVILPSRGGNIRSTHIVRTTNPQAFYHTLSGKYDLLESSITEQK